MIKHFFSKKTASKEKPTQANLVAEFSAADTLVQAMEHHQMGDFSEAETLYRQILQHQPQHPDALHFLGVMAYQRTNYDAAVALINQAIVVMPSIAMYSNLALVFQAQGNLEQLIKTYQQALLLEKNPAIYYNLANALAQQGDLKAAVASYQAGLALNPDDVEIHNQLGNAFLRLGDIDSAIASYRQVVLLKPDYEQMHNHLGYLLKGQGKFTEAIASYRQALLINPQYVEALYNLGMLFQSQAEFVQAQDYYQKALAINPDSLDVRNNLGVLFQSQKQFQKAIECFRYILFKNPEHAQAHNNLGLVFQAQDKLENAITCFHSAIALKPDQAAMYYNLANTLNLQGQLTFAIENYHKAIALDPHCSDAHNSLGLLQLTLGRFEKGWQHCEARYHPNMTDRCTVPPNLPYPQWQGESIVGKSLLIWCEQGLGDEIQFCRYVSVLKSQGARHITWVCKKPLKSLLKTLKEVDSVFTKEEVAAIGYHDYWTLALSTPLHCKTTLDNIPATIPYLYANPELVANIGRELSLITELKVGICWQGNPKFIGDALRSPGISWFKPLFKLSEVRFFTLQPDTRKEFLLNAGNSGVDRGHEINESSFEEAAALVMNLDLVITSCTSICHLAGALGKPVWIVLPFAADWRWLLEREDSPWYPNMRLFRQTEKGNWLEVFVRVESELKKLIAQKTATI